MIRKLRKKFIAAAVVAVLLVLLVLIGSINVINYRSLVAQADQTLQILSENRGSFPRQMFREQDRPAGPGMPPDAETPPAAERKGGLFVSPRGGSKELA